MTNYELQKLRDLPIEGVAERLGLRVTRHKSLCPFHDDHNASLSFHTGRNTYRCFTCGAHGGVIDLALHLLTFSSPISSPKQGRPGGVSFREACRWLANENNIILTSPPKQGDQGGLSSSPKQGRSGGVFERSGGVFSPARYERFFERPTLSEAAQRFLYDERHLDPRVISWCRITSWRDRNGIDWLQTPYYDTDGQLIGIQNRRLTHTKSPSKGDLGGLPRFRFPYGSRCSIYNLPVLKMLQPGEELWITEGCSDCWAMLSSGRKAIAIPSATLLKEQDLEPLRQVIAPPSAGGLGGSLHMYPDKDEPGEKLFLQLRDLLSPYAGGAGEGLVHHQLPLGCKDYSDYYITLKTTSL